MMLREDDPPANQAEIYAHIMVVSIIFFRIYFIYK